MSEKEYQAAMDWLYVKLAPLEWGLGDIHWNSILDELYDKITIVKKYEEVKSNAV
jgi:hypothetical protein